MASLSLLLLPFALSLLAGAIDARPGLHFYPCKTLFISYTFTSSKTIDLEQISAAQKPSYLAVYRYFRPVRSVSSSRDFSLNPSRDLRLMIVDRPEEKAQAAPALAMSSLQERAKDILVVVAGLLFGVGCGALTGTIMYLAWSLFTSRYEICRYGDGEEEEEDEIENPKKMGYVKIAEPASAKEGYEG